MIATIIDRTKHSYRRRFHSQALNASTVKEMEESILRNVRKYCRILGEESDRDWTKARDVGNIISYLTSDIIGDLTFGRNWGLIESEDNRNLPAIISQGLWGLNLVSMLVQPATEFSSSQNAGWLHASHRDAWASSNLLFETV